ncbi:MAG: hypothetical protein OQJ93_06905 [Ignavibacteriaceae bacterium]|jgi:hypothetical protein|nr:hypothetical protein [Ignavibacteriaceae bacterium]MCW8817760.1 hypothetical protein [Ignavibacteriaceae bacterium]MCW8823753.1 hypothetical protein [Ignavibacteriaceae bacterium]MCW8961154.1 hypothetical protein [Ignavibacteriaceae bacterium]MCW9097100.1 hypothetical protein [Ignavibacteriaceae bacterium]
MNQDLLQIERELKKRLSYPYKWGRKQNDQFDKLTNFVYRFPSFEDVVKEIESRFKQDKEHQNISNYALTRWYNFWSAQAVEKIFCSLPNVQPAIDKKNRLVDFTIDGVTFDHKTSIFPKNFPHPIDEAIKKTDELIKWLYKNQSQQQRKHLKNRLFIVLYSSTGEHWKLKAEISWLKERIEKYMNGFNPNFLLKFNLEPDHQTLADVIWAIR